MAKTKEEEKKEVKKKETKKEEKPEKDQLKELTELLQRTQANFENYRKQQEKRIEEIRNFANKELILQILPILDNFELALKNTGNPQEFIKGIELIYSELFTTLENQGLKLISRENRIFDPNFHEALMNVDSEEPENTILEELQKGFLLKEQVIRHAKVKVSSGKGKEEGKEEGEKERIKKEDKKENDGQDK